MIRGTYGDVRDAYKILIGNSEWKPPLGRRGYRWEDTVKVDLGGLEWEVMDCGTWCRPMVGSCELVNEDPSFVKEGKFFSS
jgi:hypothetical protein